eukprot:7651301-Alexandrium_andersonii.AAC.1
MHARTCGSSCPRMHGAPVDMRAGAVPAAHACAVRPFTLCAERMHARKYGSNCPLMHGAPVLRVRGRVRE